MFRNQEMFFIFLLFLLTFVIGGLCANNSDSYNFRTEKNELLLLSTQMSELETASEPNEKVGLDSRNEENAMQPDILPPSLISNLAAGIIGSSIVSLQRLILICYGQPFISKTGEIKRWDGSIHGEENSQHLTDWYTFNHVLHGFIFYGFTHLILPNWSVSSRFLIALATEAGWEVTENSPKLIERYQEQALAKGYKGDSIINSISDTAAMSFGFLIAHFLPVWTVIVMAIVEELVLGYVIRDNLTLNIIQIIHPFEDIYKWQNSSRTN